MPFVDLDDPFTQKMKEIGIDWNELEDGQVVEFDKNRQTIKLDDDILLTHEDLNGDTRNDIFEFF